MTKSHMENVGFLSPERMSEEALALTNYLEKRGIKPLEAVGIFMIAMRFAEWDRLWVNKLREMLDGWFNTMLAEAEARERKNRGQAN